MSDDAAIALGPLLAADFSTAPELCRRDGRGVPFQASVPLPARNSSSRMLKPMNRIKTSWLVTGD